MLQALKSWWGGVVGSGGQGDLGHPHPTFDAATQLPPAAPPKVVGKGQRSFPSYLRTTTPSDTALPATDRRLATTDPMSLRTQTSTREVIRQFTAASPDLSAAVYSYIRTGVTDGYTAVAYNTDGTFNYEATALLQTLLVRFDRIHDYTDGFSGVSSMLSNSESLAKELVQYGACSAELVLGKDRLPRQIVPISTTGIQFKPDTKWLKPVQIVGGTEIDLDIPTFFYVSLDQDLLDPYASSPLEAAIQAVLFSTDFMGDLHRIVKRAIHPRLGVQINEEKFRKYIPPEYLHDSTKLAEYMTTFIQTIESQVNGMRPEDALVYFDTLGIDYINNGNISLDAEYKVLSEITDAKVSTGAKTLPAILGHGSGSQNIASAEVLLFMKNADGAVRRKLNELYSRMLTLALRLFGLDVYAEFAYDAIDLRPEGELEAFQSMKQSRVLELLSIGLLSDEEASLQLTGTLPDAGAPKLSGTFFKAGSTDPNAADPAGNPYSGTSSGPGGGALNQSLKPGTPQQPKGPVKKPAGKTN